MTARIGRLDLAALAASRFGRFLAVGLAGLAVDMALFSLLHGLGLSRPVGRALSLSAATGVTWTLNRQFTFLATGRRRRDELARYAAVVIGAQGISYATFLAISAAAPALPPLLALVAGAVVATSFSFGGQRFFTFAAATTED